MSKEELLKEIWPDTFVGEATLAQNVFTLRRALGEAEGGRPFIETAPRRGYRFAARVNERREAETTAATDERQGASAGVAARADEAGRVGDENPTLIRPRDDGGADARAPEAAPPADADRAPSGQGHAASASRPPAAGGRTPESGNGRAQTAAPSSANAAPARSSPRDGHPVRAAVL